VSRADGRGDIDTTPAASPRISEGPQKHVIASNQNMFISSTNTSKTIDINNRHIKNIDPKIENIDETFPISPISSLLCS
jgi:hypothetical protein